MAHPRGSRRAPDDQPEPDEDEGDEEEEEDEEAPSRAPRRRRPRRDRRSHLAPLRRWRPSDEEEEEAEEARPPPTLTGRKRVYWRARDSLYFEPLVALAIIVLLLVGLYAYTQNWPPVYVVESDSMQHGSSDIVGLINTGDLVLAQKASVSSIVPYVVGLTTGYSTYGEYGDVLLYHPDGAGDTPVIHRAILFLDWNSTTGTYSAPELSGLPCGGPNAVYATPGKGTGCDTSGLSGTLDLYRIGWMSVNVSLSLSASALGRHSGFLTMGDNNYICSGPGDCTGFPDQGGGSAPEISSLVEPDWIVGVARGMIPWFGAVKLLLGGQASMVPSQSWEFLALTVVGVILLAFGIHYALRIEGIETPIRKEEEEEEREAAEEAEEEAREGRARRWLSALRPWHRTDEEEEEEEEKVTAPRRKRPPSKSTSAPGHRGRPRPEVKRPKDSKRSRRDDEEL
jgi:signal peptidase I